MERRWTRINRAGFNNLKCIHGNESSIQSGKRLRNKERKATLMIQAENELQPNDSHYFLDTSDDSFKLGGKMRSLVVFFLTKDLIILQLNWASLPFTMLKLWQWQLLFKT